MKLTPVKTTVTVNGDENTTLVLDETTGDKLKKLAKKLKGESGEPESIEYSKEYRKFVNDFGAEYAAEFLNKTTEQLKESVAVNHMSIARDKQEVEDTPAYKQAAQDLKDLKAALNEKIKPNKISIALATKILNLREDNQG